MYFLYFISKHNASIFLGDIDLKNTVKWHICSPSMKLNARILNICIVLK